jgi:hypothetical protein
MNLSYNISATPMIQGSPATMMQQQQEEEIQQQQQMEQQMEQQQMEQQQMEQQQIEQQQMQQQQMQMQMQMQQQMMNPMFQPMMQSGPPGILMIPPNGQLQSWYPQGLQPQTWDLGGGSRVTVSDGLVVVDTSGSGWGNGNYTIL